MRSVIGAVLCLAAWPAHADFFNGNELHSACTGREPFSLNFYIAGVHDKANADTAIANYFVSASEVQRNPDLAQIAKSIRPYCISGDVTLQQLRDVVCQYLAKTPANRHFAAAPLVQTSLAEAFPCPK